jgi:hypothetical protein
MNFKLITYLVITSSYINYMRAINTHSHTNRRPLLRCNSAPDITALYNTTAYTSVITASATKDIIPYNKYKSIIFNRYKRNIYLRSKEKYTLDENK